MKKQPAISAVIGITAYQVGNLRKLAKGLREVHKNSLAREQFNMEYYLRISELGIYAAPDLTSGGIKLIDSLTKRKTNKVIYPCGTSACAVGFAPLLIGGIQVLKRNKGNFNKYAKVMFGAGAGSNLYTWLFSGNWRYTKYTSAEDVANRIDLLLKYRETYKYIERFRGEYTFFGDYDFYAIVREVQNETGVDLNGYLK